MVSRLDDVHEDIRDLRTELAAHRLEMVSRGEWEMRNRAVDSRFEAQGREISELKHAQSAARAPCWTWAAVLLAVASFGWSVLGPAITVN